MTVAILLVATLLLPVACTAAQGNANDKEVTMTTISRGPNAASRSGPVAILATTEADYRSRWSSLVGRGDAPAVDFSRSVVVFLLAGERNTGGWSVEPKGVTVEGTTAVVDAEVRGPAPDMIVTQALTYPYAVVSIDSRDVDTVRWPQ